MRRCGCLLAALTLAVLPPPAAAQSAGSEDIVVTGELREQARRNAKAYVRQLGVANGERPTARWFDAICPRAIGLSKEHAAIVEGQIRQIIREVGAPLAKAGCSPNFAVAFTDGPEQVVRRIAGAGRELAPSVARELAESEAPIRWWYNTELRSRDGVPAADAPLPWAFIGAAGVIPLPTGESGSVPLYNSSMVSTQVIRAIHSATVIVDVERGQGVPLKSVIDYTALVGLSEIMLGASPADSVLSLYQPGGDRQLTRRDRAFLTSLYRIPMDRRAGQQRRAIVQAMVTPKDSN